MNIPEGFEIKEQSDDRIVLERVKDYDWVPGYNEKYFLLGVAGMHLEDTWLGLNCDKGRLAFGNVHPSKKHAEKAAKLQRRSNQIIRACLLVDPDFEPDWEDEGQYKYFASKYHGVWVYDEAYLRDCSSAYVSSKEKCDEVIKLLKKWGVE